MRNNVPFHLAFGLTAAEADYLILDPIELAAMSIHFSEFEGARFNWSQLRFEEPKT